MSASQLEVDEVVETVIAHELNLADNFKKHENDFVVKMRALVDKIHETGNTAFVCGRGERRSAALCMTILSSTAADGVLNKL